MILKESKHANIPFPPFPFIIFSPDHSSPFYPVSARIHVSHVVSESNQITLFIINGAIERINFPFIKTKSYHYTITSIILYYRIIILYYHVITIKFKYSCSLVTYFISMYTHWEWTSNDKTNITYVYFITQIPENLLCSDKDFQRPFFYKSISV